MTLPLFDDDALPRAVEALGQQTYVLRGYARSEAEELLGAIRQIESLSPFRHMQTPGGFTMSVALTNCGQLGWCSDRRGYRYSELDPLTNRPWPALPQILLELARTAASEAGFPDFVPDACLVNRYAPGARLTLHQDKNEQKFEAPIVSVSLGVPAVFLFGGLTRTDRAARIPLRHGDIVVWGGVDRLRYHGVLPLKEDNNLYTGIYRYNLTLRRAGP